MRVNVSYQPLLSQLCLIWLHMSLSHILLSRPIYCNGLKISLLAKIWAARYTKWAGDENTCPCSDLFLVNTTCYQNIQRFIFLFIFANSETFLTIATTTPTPTWMVKLFQNNHSIPLRTSQLKKSNNIFYQKKYFFLIWKRRKYLDKHCNNNK